MCRTVLDREFAAFLTTARLKRCIVYTQNDESTKYFRVINEQAAVSKRSAKNVMKSS